jgi:hypothetical protein
MEAGPPASATFLELRGQDDGNALAERFVGTIRQMCFDRMLVFNRH